MSSFYIVTCILCIALIYIVKCYTQLYEKRRRDTYSYWHNYPWVEKGRPKFSRLYIIVSVALSFVPVLNVLLLIGAIVNYIVVNIGPRFNYSDKLVVTKVSLAKVNRFTSWLFEKV